MWSGFNSFHAKRSSSFKGSTLKSESSQTKNNEKDNDKLMPKKLTRSQTSPVLRTHHSEPIREDMVQLAVGFFHVLASSTKSASPEPQHILFLENKGLTINEIQEAINRISTHGFNEPMVPKSANSESNGSELDPDMSMWDLSDVDPIYLLPPQKYEQFLILLRMNNTKATNLAKSISSFVNLFKRGLVRTYTLDDKGKLVCNQIELLVEQVIQLYTPRKQSTLTASDSLYNKYLSKFVGDTSFVAVNPYIVSECVEKYLMTCLYDAVFNAPYDPSNSTELTVCSEMSTEDLLLHDKVDALRDFVTLEHLEIESKLSDSSLWSISQQVEELLNINMYKAPRDKLLCIVKACKIIFSAIRVLNNDDQPISADIFLPMFIYNLIQANPPFLKANMNYIQHFRPSSKMQHESGYFFVSYCTAVHFLDILDASRLKIDPEEYARRMKGRPRILSAAVPRATTAEQHERHKQMYNVNDHLLHSCAAGDIETTKKLIEYEGAYIDFTKNTPAKSVIRVGDFPLSVAARFGNIDIVKYLLRKGADVNMVPPEDENMRNVLHWECIGHDLAQEKFWNVEVIKALVAYGADTQALDKWGKTPLDYATPQIKEVIEGVTSRKVRQRESASKVESASASKVEAQSAPTPTARSLDSQSSSDSFSAKADSSVYVSLPRSQSTDSLQSDDELIDLMEQKFFLDDAWWGSVSLNEGSARKLASPTNFNPNFNTRPGNNTNPNNNNNAMNEDLHRSSKALFDDFQHFVQNGGSFSNKYTKYVNSNPDPLLTPNNINNIPDKSNSDRSYEPIKPSQSVYLTHLVKPNDTLESVAAAYGTTVRILSSQTYQSGGNAERSEPNRRNNGQSSTSRSHIPYQKIQ